MLEKSTTDFSLQFYFLRHPLPKPSLKEGLREGAHPIIDSHPLDSAGAKELFSVKVVEQCGKSTSLRTKQQKQKIRV